MSDGIGIHDTLQASFLPPNIERGVWRISHRGGGRAKHGRAWGRGTNYTMSTVVAGTRSLLENIGLYVCISEV